MDAYLRMGAYSRQRFGGTYSIILCLGWLLIRGGSLFEDGRLFEAKIWMHLFNNPVSRVGAYSRLGVYLRGGA